MFSHGFWGPSTVHALCFGFISGSVNRHGGCWSLVGTTEAGVVSHGSRGRQPWGLRGLGEQRRLAWSLMDLGVRRPCMRCAGPSLAQLNPGHAQTLPLRFIIALPSSHVTPAQTNKRRRSTNFLLLIRFCWRPLTAAQTNKEEEKYKFPLLIRFCWSQLLPPLTKTLHHFPILVLFVVCLLCDARLLVAACVLCNGVFFVWIVLHCLISFQ